MLALSCEEIKCIMDEMSASLSLIMDWLVNLDTAFKVLRVFCSFSCNLLWQDAITEIQNFNLPL